MNQSFEWSPYLPQIYYIALAVLAVVALVIARWRKVKEFSWRAVFFLILILVLLNPIFLNEIRLKLPDKLIVVMDESASQRISGRDKVAEEALAYIKESLAKTNVEPVVIRSGTGPESSESTDLFTLLRNHMTGIPMSQVAGTVLITDGEVHDVPKDLGTLSRLGPFHTILTGKKDEFDRKITVVSAPKYGVLNETVTVRVKLEEFGHSTSGSTTVTIKQDGQTARVSSISTGQEQEFTFGISHPGQNIFEFIIPPEEGELSTGNNNAPVIVNGIRDRLRVLLVSGSPHMGQRAWRNLLKSDPAIDLVHFTILRGQLSFDVTPQSQLSLIQFPMEELFQKKINDFDLIIFDRYQNEGGIMPPFYFSNIANYIRKGGALLSELGTSDSRVQHPDGGFINSEIDYVLPLIPASAETVRLPFRPVLSSLGARHPVTADLMRLFKEKPWGLWYAQVDAAQPRGQALMTGIEGRPLLVIDKVGAGRVAALASDNVWLWSKGGDMAGPYTDLMRNVAHWLMKEPELEDDFIKAEAKGNVITVSQRDLTPEPKSVMMTTPEGKQSLVPMVDREPGWIKASVNAVGNGIYGFDNGVKKAFVVVGSARNEEFSDVHTTEDKLKPVTEATQGAMIWYQENQHFKLRDVTPTTHILGGDDWLGMKRNSSYTIDNVESLSLLPNPLTLLIILLSAVWMWWRESGNR